MSCITTITVISGIITAITGFVVCREAYLNQEKVSSEFIFMQNGDVKLKFVNTGNRTAMIKDFEIEEIRTNRLILGFSDVSEKDIIITPKEQSSYTFDAGSAFNITNNEDYSIKITLRTRNSIKISKFTLIKTFGKSQDI